MTQDCNSGHGAANPWAAPTVAGGTAQEAAPTEDEAVSNPFEESVPEEAPAGHDGVLANPFGGNTAVATPFGSADMPMRTTLANLSDQVFQSPDGHGPDPATPR